MITALVASLAGPAQAGAGLQQVAVDAPAMAVLGQETALQQPTTASDLTASLQAGAEGGFESYALEVAPWWLRSRPDLTLEDYLSPGPRAALYDLRISVGGALGGLSDDSEDDAELSLGARTSLLRGTSRSEALAPCLDALDEALTERADWLAARAPTPSDEQLAALDDGSLTEEALTEWLDAAYEALEDAHADEVEAIQDTCEDEVAIRQGWAVDISLAGALVAPEGNAARATPSAYGAWLSPAWLDDDWGVVGLVGAFGQALDDGVGEHRLELGGQLLYVWDRVAIAPESVYRYAWSDTETPHQGRVALGVDARLADGLWLTSYLGVELPLDREGSLLSGLGLRFSSGDERAIVPQTAPLLWSPDG